VEQVQWLGRVLSARSFPIERLVTHVRLTAIALRGPGLGEIGAAAADRMQRAAAALAAEQTDPEPDPTDSA
jgi:hypothetical protein